MVTIKEFRALIVILFITAVAMMLYQLYDDNYCDNVAIPVRCSK